MAWFQLFLMDRDGRIIGRSDYRAEDKVSGFRIAWRIAEACSDACAGYDLLQDGKLVASVSATVGKPDTDLTEFEQKVAMDMEIALSDSL